MNTKRSTIKPRPLGKKQRAHSEVENAREELHRERKAARKQPGQPKVLRAPKKAAARKKARA